MYLPLKKIKKMIQPHSPGLDYSSQTGLFKSHKFIQELRSAPSWKIYKFELFNQVLLTRMCHPNNAALGHH